jgi:hypothetical protein
VSDLAADLAAGRRRHADYAVVGLLGLGEVDGELVELPLELPCTCLYEVEVAVEVYVDVPTQELGCYFEEVAEPGVVQSANDENFQSE